MEVVRNMDNTSACNSPLHNMQSSVNCSPSDRPSLDSNIVDWSRPITKCIAGEYADLAVNNTVYNKNTLTDDIWIELPAYAKQFLVCGIYQINPNAASLDSLPLHTVRHKNIWLRIPTQVVDTSAGHKIYRAEFKHKHTLELMILYFNYTIQDDQPCKPYVYMR